MAELLRRGRSTVSVVVGCTDASSAFLAACLASLADQGRPPDEVLLAVSGGGPDTRVLVESEVRSWTGDGELRVVEGAVVEGLVRATGTYVMMIEAGDALAPGAVGSLAGSLDRSGADLAVQGTHPRAAATLETAPTAVVGAGLAALMQRTAFSREVAPVAAPALVGEWLPAVHALLRATSFDVVAGPVRRGPRRGTGLAFGALPDVAPHLRRVVPLLEAVLVALSDASRVAAREHFVHWLLASEVAGYLADAERCDDESWEVLAGLVRRLAQGALPGPVESRVRVWLAAAGRRTELEAFNADRWSDGGDYPTVVSEGRVRAVLPVADVPDHVLEVSPEESPLVTRLHRARWVEDGCLELEVLAFTRMVGAACGPAAVGVTAVSRAGERLRLQVSPVGSPEVDQVAGERHHDHADGLYRVLVDPGEIAARAPSAWSLEVDWVRAGVRRTGTVEDWERRGSAGAVAPRALDGRTIRLDPASARLVCDTGDPGVDRDGRPEITALSLEGDVLVLSGEVAGADDGPLRVRVRGNRGSCAVRVRLVDGAFTARVPLRHDPWGLGEVALPPGGYRVRLQGGPQGPMRMVLGERVAARTPYVERGSHFRMVVERNPDGTAHLVLGPPLADDELGARAQRALQRWHTTDEHRIDPRRVYLQSYAGTTATDSPLAIHRELRRTRPDLRLVWAVASSSVTVPEGGERVLMRSREWYRELSTCGHVVTNIELNAWFRKRPGQRVLQTSHGYPGKSVGVQEWRSKHLSPSMIERQLRRTSGTWDLLLTPHPDLEVHLREQYRYGGPVLSSGYPRDDDLVGPAARRRRADVRRRLGVEGRTVVLYAPTWRDDLSIGHRSAVLAPTFDVHAAARTLGPDHVILMRGHRFHRHRPSTGSGVIDVTGYPEVNDLILAADAGVLDYSSLRFDLALTGRPMVFLVPDLERYEADVRGFLYDFRSSAPGPLLETTAEVVDALRDLDRVAAGHREEYARFNRRFNAYQDGQSARRAVETFFGQPEG